MSGEANNLSGEANNLSGEANNLSGGADILSAVRRPLALPLATMDSIFKELQRATQSVVGLFRTLQLRSVVAPGSTLLFFLLLAGIAHAEIAPAPADRPSPGTEMFLPPDKLNPAAQMSTPLFSASGRNIHDPAVAKGGGIVQWRVWGREALAEAVKMSKPVLLFITSNWCHAGRTMERTTFTDLEVATLLNEEFIPIRMNRDEHPEIDIRMQQAVKAVSGLRGWPLTVFLTPEGRVFFGGTHFEVEDDGVLERSGMRSLIHSVIQTWRKDRRGVEQQARILEEKFRKSFLNESMQGEIHQDVLNHIALKIQNVFDAKAGGFLDAGGTKFPAPRALELCLIHAARTGDKESLKVAVTTLQAMRRGGLYDHLAGGFFRYCSDRWWRAPHFEKLLGLNAEMLPIYLHAWQVTGDKSFKEVVEQTLNFWMGMTINTPPEKERSGKSGGVGEVSGFFGSQSADASDIDDGDYYTWTIKDVEDVLRDDTDCLLAREFYDIKEIGDLPLTAPDRNVLFESLSLAQVANSNEFPMAQVWLSLKHVREILLDTRQKRPTPTIDRTIYPDGNAMMAAAFIECGRALDKPAYVVRGIDTVKYLLKAAEHPSTARGLAQDDAAIAYACAIAFEACGEIYFADAAESRLRGLFQHYWDNTEGGYFDCKIQMSDDGSAKLPETQAGDSQAPKSKPACHWPIKIFQDTPEPSANALAAMACVRMAALTDRSEYVERAKSILKAFGGVLERSGPYGASLASVADALQHGITLIRVVGKPDDPRVKELLCIAYLTYVPCKIVRVSSLDEARGITTSAERRAHAVVRIGEKQEIVYDSDALKKVLETHMPLWDRANP